MRSSYKENGYDKVFFALMEAFRPMRVVELGVLDGFSTIHLAKGLKHNFDTGYYGERMPEFDAYDLFEDYQYKHGELSKVQKCIKKEGLQDFVKLHKGDAFKVWKGFEDHSIHFLHVDISNTGETLRNIMKLWNKKVVIGGWIAFEGGSYERDEVDWMKKYGKEPIRPELLKNECINKNHVWGTYKQFPSLTVMLKKWENVWYDIQGNPHTE